MRILVIAEHDHNEIKKATTLSTLTAAWQISDNIDLLIAGNNIEELCEKAQSIDSIEKIIKIDDEKLTYFLPEYFSQIIIPIAQNYTHILAPASAFGKNVMPYIAALLDIQQISDVTKIIDEKTFKRPIYAGRALSTITSNQPLNILTIRPSAFKPAEQVLGKAKIEEMSISFNSIDHTKLIKQELTNKDRPDLENARIIIAGGSGLEKLENVVLLEKIAHKLKAAIGAARGAVDAGFIKNDYLIGQTGKTIAPELYIAVGLSGISQHICGIMDSKIIVAINKDPEAPIFKIADYGLVADINDVLPELESKI